MKNLNCLLQIIKITFSNRRELIFDSKEKQISKNRGYWIGPEGFRQFRQKRRIVLSREVDFTFDVGRK